MKKGFAKAAFAITVAGLIAFAVVAAAPAGTSLNTSGWASHLSAAQVHSLSTGQDQRVIVLLRNQHNALLGRSNEARREQAFTDDRAPIVAQLRQLGVPRLIAYHSVNAIATTVTSAEKANLLRDPAVLAVDPDVVVKGPSTNANLLPVAAAKAAPTTRSGSPIHASGKVGGSAVCGTASAPLLEPQALHLINADNRTNADAPITSGPASAHSLGYTGSGVNIAVFPEGMDPTLPDFMRGGNSAVTDYKDFTGEGTNAPTSGGEAFGDVSSLVAQGNQTYNLAQEVNPDFAPAGTCDIKVLGVAPGADVDVMKVFGENNLSFTSMILQGIDYAIQTDHANILSISIGFFASPSSAAEQPLTAILDSAMKDGTTVVASTGDASPSNTEESPALDPGVIGAAASTSYRIFAQANLFLYDLAGAVHGGTGDPEPGYHVGQSTPGWLDNQVSTLSSSGVTEDGRVPDILAPGDLNWAVCSTDTAMYTDCANSLGGQTIGLLDFGGTSESTPLTAGVAALVIQAYRQTHGNKTPTPAVVKQILYSTSTDVGIAADEQGAGLLNALRAVEMAKVYGKHGSGGGLAFAPSSFSDVGTVGATHSHKVEITNNGSTAATITPELRTLGPAKTIAHGSMSLFQVDQGVQGTCAGIDQAEYYTGQLIDELNCVKFKVPKGVDELDSRIAWNPLQPCSGCTAGEPTAREILIDPAGRYAQYSDPQGDGAGFADAQIHQPTAGSWTLLIFGRATSNYEGPVSYMETTQKFKAVGGAISPASKVVGPGKSASFTVKVKDPSTAGFFTGAVVFKSTKEKAVGTIPVTAEAKVPVSLKKPGHFTGTLIGGNGRPAFFAQQLSYRFVVPKGVKDLDVNMTVANDGYFLLGQLVDPSGHAVDNQLSYQVVTADFDSSNTHAVQLVWANPKPGTWKVDVANGLLYLPGLDVWSGLTQSTLHGTVSFNTSKVSSSGLPSGTLPVGHKVTAHVLVKNTGAEPETYQLDPRTTSQTPLTAVSVTDEGGTLPVTDATTIPQYIVPPFSSKLQLSASTTGSTPIEFDTSTYWGAPDVASGPSTGGTASMTISNPFASEWAPTPVEVGPFASPATPEPFTTSGTVTTLGFDTSAIPDTGDLWEDVLGPVNEPLTPLFLLPGQTGEMSVTFTVPNVASGTKISGEIPVETFDYNSITTGVGDWSSDVLKVVPYSYTVG